MGALSRCCPKHKPSAEQPCNSYTLDFFISFPLLGKFELRSLEYSILIRAEITAQKKRSCLNSSQILHGSEISGVTSAVLQPKRSREEAAHQQKQGRGRSPADFAELWISPKCYLRHSLLSGTLSAFASLPASLFSIICIIPKLVLKLETLHLSAFELPQFPFCGLQEMYSNMPQEKFKINYGK